MIYPSEFPTSIDNPSEKEVFNALAKLPEVDFDIFFSKCFSGSSSRESDDYEIDFLVIDKRNERFNAMLVIEVKGGALSYSAKENCWYQSGRKMHHGPDAQAKKNKHNLIKRYKNLLYNVPTEWALWFPEGYSSAGSFTPTQLAPWQVLDRQCIEEAQSAIIHTFDKINERYPTHPGESIETYNNKLQKSLLRGMGIIQPLNILLKQLEQKFIFLEDMQKLFFEQLYQQERVAVSGGAGTGKTLMASAAAIDFANEGKNVLLLCYNRMLNEAFEATCTHENITSSTFHSFAYEFIATIEPGWYEAQNKEDQTFFEETFPKKFGSMVKAHPEKLQYDALIIDEAQDFNEHWVKIILKLTKANGQVVLLYDENQDIFDRHFHIPEEDSFMKINLKYNFRNTQNISAYVSEKTSIAITPKETPKGLPVNEIEYTDFEDLRKKLELNIQQLVTIEKLKCHDITILVDGHLHEHPLNEVDKISHYPLLPWHADTERQNNTLLFTTINRFKGLESQVVLLILDGKHDLNKNKTFYTQCTRAKSLLRVFIAR